MWAWTGAPADRAHARTLGVAGLVCVGAGTLVAVAVAGTGYVVWRVFGV